MKIVNKIINNVYYWPLVLSVGYGELVFFILRAYYIWTGNLEKTIELFVQSVLTFSSIIIPILVLVFQKRDDDKRSLKIYLGLVWHELIKNNFLLSQIEINYKFKELFAHVAIFRDLTAVIKGKFESIYNQVIDLRQDSYIAIQNSGAIKTIDEDDLFNDLIISYDNLANLQSAISITFENIKMKEFLANQTFDPLSPEQELFFKEELRQQIITCYQELAYAIALVNKAIASLDMRLNKLKVKSKFVRRELPIIQELP